jgi:Porin PorA
MLRGTGLVASALGAFLIVLALFTRFYIADQALKFPLNEHTVTTMSARDVSYFSPSELQELTGVTMTDTTTTEGDVASGSTSTAVWNNFSYIFDQTNDIAYNYSLDRLAFDRRSGDLVNCCGANINGKRIHFSGLGYVWPLGAQKTTYQIFDTTLMATHPVSYAGTATVDGLATYRYVESVAPTRIGTQQLPGSLVGMLDQATVSLGEIYAGTTTDYVDPISGAPLKVRSSQHLYLVDGSGKAVLNLLNGTFATVPASVAAAVHTAKSYDAKVFVVTVILPATIGLAGIIVLIIGVIMARIRPDSDYEKLTPAGYGGGASSYQGGEDFRGGQAPV